MTSEETIRIGSMGSRREPGRAMQDRSKKVSMEKIVLKSSAQCCLKQQPQDTKMQGQKESVYKSKR